MTIRHRIGADGGGAFLADYVDILGHRRAKQFESREAAEEFLKRMESERNDAVLAKQPDPVEGAA